MKRLFVLLAGLTALAMVFAQMASAATTYYAPTNGVVSWTDGNIMNDPMFIANGNGQYGTNHVAGNYRLKPDSPCLNRGTNFAWMSDPADARSKDLDGRARIDRFSGQVDMGCYEHLPSGTMYGFR